MIELSKPGDKRPAHGVSLINISVRESTVGDVTESHQLPQSCFPCHCADFKSSFHALAGWFSWLEHHLVHQKVGSLIPGQGTYLGCRFCPLLECIWEVANWCFSLTSMFLFLSLSLSIPPSLWNQQTYPWVRIKKQVASVVVCLWLTWTCGYLMDVWEGNWKVIALSHFQYPALWSSNHYAVYLKLIQNNIERKVWLKTFFKFLKNQEK